MQDRDQNMISQRTPHTSSSWESYGVYFGSKLIISTGIILCVHLANERQHYNVTSSLIGWAHIQNFPCIILCMSPADERGRYNVTSSLIDCANIQNDLCIKKVLNCNSQLPQLFEGCQDDAFTSPHHLAIWPEQDIHRELDMAHLVHNHIINTRMTDLFNSSHYKSTGHGEYMHLFLSFVMSLVCIVVSIGVYFLYCCS